MNNEVLFIKWLWKSKAHYQYFMEDLSSKKGDAHGIEPVWQEIFSSRDDNLPLQNERRAGVINNTCFEKQMQYCPFNFPGLNVHSLTKKPTCFTSVISYCTYCRLYPETASSCHTHYADTRCTNQPWIWSLPYCRKGDRDYYLYCK